MTDARPSHAYEVQRWLGLVPFDPPTGLHGEARVRLIARHTRIQPGKGASDFVTQWQRQAAGSVPMASEGQWRWLRAAIATTYPRHRERQVMAVLRPQELDDRLWRWVYALMVTGGPLLLPELYALLARLTGPRDEAQAEAVRRYQQWAGDTYEPD